MAGENDIPQNFIANHIKISWQYKILLVYLLQKRDYESTKDEEKLVLLLQRLQKHLWFYYIYIWMHFGFGFFSYCTISIDTETYLTKKYKYLSNSSISLGCQISFFIILLIYFSNMVTSDYWKLRVWYISNIDSKRSFIKKIACIH